MSVLVKAETRRRHHRYTGRRSVLWNRSGRQMDVDVGRFRKVGIETEFVRVGTDPGQSGLGRFLHDIAELARHGQVPTAFRHIRFNKQDVAADGSPRQTDRHPGAASPALQLPLRAEISLNREIPRQPHG